MRCTLHMTGLALVLMVSAGCSDKPGTASHPEPATPTSDHPGQAGFDPGANEGDDIAWADQLIDAYRGWETTTERYVATSAFQSALCVSPSVVPRQALGPHGQHSYWVYVNPEGRAAFLGFDVMPAGSVIVKEKHVVSERAETHRAPTGLGVMVKREPGFAPELGDWEYAYITFDQAGRAAEVSRGDMASCIDCHAYRDQTDYLYRDYLPGARAQPDPARLPFPNQPGGLGGE